MLSLEVDLASFELLNYQLRFAILLGVEQLRVRVTAAAGSTIVTTRVETQTAELQRLSTILVGLTPASASLALGFDVATISTGVEILPPQAEPPPPPPIDNDSLPIWIIAVAVAGALAAFVLLGLLLVLYKRRQRAAPRRGTPHQALRAAVVRRPSVMPVVSQRRSDAATPVVLGTVVEKEEKPDGSSAPPAYLRPAPGDDSDSPNQRPWGNFV